MFNSITQFRTAILPPERVYNPNRVYVCPIYNVYLRANNLPYEDLPHYIADDLLTIIAGHAFSEVLSTWFQQTTTFKIKVSDLKTRIESNTAFFAKKIKNEKIDNRWPSEATPVSVSRTTEILLLLPKGIVWHVTLDPKDMDGLSVIYMPLLGEDQYSDIGASLYHLYKDRIENCFVDVLVYENAEDFCKVTGFTGQCPYVLFDREAFLCTMQKRETALGVWAHSWM